MSETAEVKAPSKTDLIVASMLTENTGRALCDSGGAYGRNWEINQGKNVEAFEKEPVFTVEFFATRKRYPYTDPDNERAGKPMPGPGELEVMASVSLYHWMTHMFEFDEDLQKQLEEFARRSDQEDCSWFEVVSNWVDSPEMKKRQGKREAFIENTYNNTDHWDLTQVMQYTGLYLDGDSDYAPTHLVIMVHGGCDVRGGYTAPKVFKNNGGDDGHDYLEAGHVNEIYTNEGCVKGHQYWSFEGWIGSFAETSRTYDDPMCDIPFKDIPVYASDWLEAPATDPVPESGWFIVVHEHRAFLINADDLSPKDRAEIIEGKSMDGGDVPWDVISNELSVGNTYL